MEILRKNKGMNTFYELSLPPGRFFPYADREEETTLPVPAGDVGGTYVMEMLMNNMFSYLLPVQVQWMDGRAALLYRGDGMQSMAAGFACREPGWEMVQCLMTDIGMAIRELQEYLLPPEGIVFSSRAVFYDETLGHFRFLYSPICTEHFAGAMKKLMEEIMPFYSHHVDTEVVLFYDLYSRFLDDSFTPELFLGLVENGFPSSAGDCWGRSMPAQTGAGTEEVISQQTAGWAGVNPLTDGNRRGEDTLLQNTGWAGGNPSPAGERRGGDPFPQTGGWAGGDPSPTGERREEGRSAGKRGLPVLAVLTLILAGVLAVGILLYLITGKGWILTASALVGGGGAIAAAGALHRMGEEKERVTTEQKNKEGQQETGNPERRSPGRGESGRDRKFRSESMCGSGCGYGTETVRGSWPGQRGVTCLIPSEQENAGPIEIAEGVFRIGRSEQENEYCIPRPGISRNHARIEVRSGQVLLQDMNSTNGTYVNRERVACGMTRELHYGDVVSFAGEEFYCV